MKKKKFTPHGSGPAFGSNGQPSGEGEGGGGHAIDDDIVAQLQRQRQKQAQQAKQCATVATITNTPRELSPAGIDASRNGRSMGKFQYDPATKRYFPKSDFATNGNNNACTQQIQKQLQFIDNADANNIEMKRYGDNVTTSDIRSMIFRGPCLLNDNICNSNGQHAYSSLLWHGGQKRKKLRAVTRIEDSSPPFSGTQRMAILQTTSLEYCSSFRRRNAIVSKLEPITIARRATVKPNLSTLERLRSETKIWTHQFACDGRQQKRQLNAWPIQSTKSRSEPSSAHQLYAMLRPLSNQETSWNDDCDCKSYLQPTAPTFDVIPSYRDRHSIAMPHMATLSNDGVYYQRPSRDNTYSWLELHSHPAHSSNKSQGVRLATNGQKFFVGCIVYDSWIPDKHSFKLKQTMYNTEYEAVGHVQYSLPSPVNDFCFVSDLSLQVNSEHINLSVNSNLVAFAHGGDDKIGASFLDIATGSNMNISANWSKSEPLCVKFRSNNESNHVLFGHRDGSVSMLDTRSQDALCLSLTSGASFGSVTTLQPLQKDTNLVAAKGSFGTCCLFDLRRMSSCTNPTRHQQSKLFELSVPDHILHPTKSVRCTGLAIDPSGCIAIAPFADRDDDIRFAIWDIGTGDLLRTLNLNCVDDCITSNVGKSAVIPAFCELSSVITPGYSLHCNRDSDLPIVTCEGWGVWYKTNSFINEGGCIHHLSF